MTIADPKLVVRSNDLIIVCVGIPGNYTIQSDDPGLVAEVKNHLKLRTATPIISGRPNLLFAADDSTYLGILSAMFAPDPGRSLLLRAPDRVLYELREFNNEGIGFILRTS